MLEESFGTFLSFVGASRVPTLTAETGPPSGTGRRVYTPACTWTGSVPRQRWGVGGLEHERQSSPVPGGPVPGVPPPEPAPDRHIAHPADGPGPGLLRARHGVLGRLDGHGPLAPNQPPRPIPLAQLLL